MKKILMILITVMLAMSSMAFAQETEENTETSTKQAKLKFLKDYFFSVYFDTSFDYFKNGDLRDTDSTSMTSVQFSDDEMFLGYYKLGVKFKAVLYKDLQFYFDIYNSGFWGNDSPEYEAEGNTLFLKSAYFLAPFYKGKGMEFGAALGRQRYRVSGTEKSSIESGTDGMSLGGGLYRFHRHFIMDDTIDALVLYFKHNKIGLAIDAFVDLYSLNSPGDSFYSMRADRHAFTVQFFEGDVNVIRAAIAPSYTLDNKGPLDKMKLKVFSSYAHIGAVGIGTNTSGGYEISNAGTSSNKPDGDWLLINSASLYLKFIKRLSVYFEFAHSYGKDYKNPMIQKDVTINGFMLHPSIEFDIYDWLKIGAAGIYVQGSTTDKNGNYTNYGFVSMKGNKIGGFLFSDYYGNYPYAVVDYYGIWYDGYKTIRRAPMASVNFALVIENLNLKTRKKGVEGLNLILEGWFYFDTNTTGADFNDSSLPAHVFDQKRLPKEGSYDVAFMGFETDLMISYTFFKGLLEVGAKCGVFVPWTYFDYPVSDQTAPAGSDVFWGIEFFSKVRF